MKDSVCAVVVTYNRKNLLVECLEAIRKQTRPVQGICLVDNASTDGTSELLLEKGYISELPSEDLKKPWNKEFIIHNLTDGNAIRFHYVRMNENIGGAGGFYEGIKEALNMNFDYIWLMDDDAEPTKNALSSLVAHARPDRCIASLAVVKDSEELTWPLIIRIGGKCVVVDHIFEIPSTSLVEALFCPFLGVLIPIPIVKKVGLPIKEYFIWGDDVEYTKRIRKFNFPIFFVPKSLIYHPIQSKYRTSFLWRKKVILVDAPDWKQYYGFRNHIHMAVKDRDIVSILRNVVVFFLIWNKRGAKLDTLHYYVEALIDGFRGHLGKRY